MANYVGPEVARGKNQENRVPSVSENKTQLSPKNEIYTRRRLSPKTKSYNVYIYIERAECVYNSTRIYLIILYIKSAGSLSRR